MKELSCGFIILNKKDPRFILACQPNGRVPNRFGNYDIPKGHMEDGETPFDAAIRELREETGYEITDETIYDCGTFQYLSYKDLHVFLMIADFDIHELRCDSKFENDKGKMVNEIVGYKWVDDLRFFYKSLQPIINECLNHYEEGYYEEMD
jgi:8-oxo-dGTP pyrophosphatase MutT (NUDIX family)